MKFVVYSRREMESLTPPTVPYSIISINGTDQTPAILPINENCLGSLVMHFDDIEKEYPHLRYAAFNDNDATTVLNFIVPLVEEHGEHVCLVHCDAGVSRSQAVGAALCVIFNGNGTDGKYFSDGIPNMNVYRRILNAHFYK